MSSFDRHIQSVQEGASALADAMGSADQAWRDAKRASFQDRTADPLLRQARQLTDELRSCAAAVDGALRSVGRR